MLIVVHTHIFTVLLVVIDVLGEIAIASGAVMVPEAIARVEAALCSEVVVVRVDVLLHPLGVNCVGALGVNDQRNEDG